MMAITTTNDGNHHEQFDEGKTSESEHCFLGICPSASLAASSWHTQTNYCICAGFKPLEKRSELARFLLFLRNES
jgi:hypothetical protein